MNLQIIFPLYFITSNNSLYFINKSEFDNFNSFMNINDYCGALSLISNDR